MSQVERIHQLLLDGKPHRTDEIVEKVYGPGCALARVAARICDLKKKLPPHWRIDGWKDDDEPTLYWYQLKTCSTSTDLTLFPDALIPVCTS